MIHRSEVLWASPDASLDDRFSKGFYDRLREHQFEITDVHTPKNISVIPLCVSLCLSVSLLWFLVSPSLSLARSPPPQSLVCTNVHWSR